MINNTPQSFVLNNKQPRLLFMMLLAFMIGIITGFGTIVFRGVIAFFHNILFLGKVSFIYHENHLIVYGE